MTTTTAKTGRRMDLRAIGFAGHRRDAAIAEAAHELELIIDELVAAGDLANVSLAAKLAGVSRTTIYARLAERGPGA